MSGEKIRYDGEVVLVAGGGGSLGGAYARLFGARGAKVVVNDVNESALAVADQIKAAGGTAIAVLGSSASNAPQIVEKVLGTYGRLDVVVNSAGQTNGGLFHQIPADDWDRVFDSHFTATLALARAVWPHLVASGNGRLINTSSTSIFGSAYSSCYIAAKAAIFAASKTWAMEGASQNVRVNVVMPTAISQMTRNIPDPNMVALLEENFQPEKVAGLIVWLAHRDSTLNGLAIEAGGGRAAAVFLAEADSVTVQAPDSPESWLGSEAALTSRAPKYVPSSMMDELMIRLKDMGPAVARAAGDASANDVWSTSKK